MSTTELSRIIRVYIGGVTNKSTSQVETVLAEDLEWISPLGKFVGKEQAKKYCEKWLIA